MSVDSTSVPLSILDLAPIGHDETPGQSFTNSVALAQAAERTGYQRVWYAEHHNMPVIASSATSVLIAHIAAHTSTIRLGAGGVMLPNHSPLTIAEQFGTLESLHPGRIDLGLGRAPGGDRAIFDALRRDPGASEQFPQDVLELQAYLGSESRVASVNAYPGKDANVPLYILGSSLFGAQLAAALGLPYAFASHFAPDALHEAVALYRRDFTPSKQLDHPYVIAGANVFAADTTADAGAQFEAARRRRVRGMIARNQAGIEYTDAQIDDFLTTPAGANIANMMRHTAIGTPEEVAVFLADFALEAQADELIVAHGALNVADRLRSVELAAPAS
ncbi:LLM class flavin-dependent oxidoreductase [Demequina aurantiaca]|uniref:LLM class flavin-dependent oxidoreductase n=1 Tax=Demequina aurantiaca TaxID=676200 RepID=UPI000783C300|nr:LLM class flavin-dependent oxidoreductase [Demequina aurantiaca]